jgi:hypothetical protein
VRNVRYEYEKEGYDLGALGWYLPDFWLPTQKAWVEIKPREAFTAKVDDRAEALARGTGYPVFLLLDAPQLYATGPYGRVGSLGYKRVVSSDKGHVLTCPVGCLPRDSVGLLTCSDAEYYAAVQAARQARFEYGERPAPREALATSRIPASAWGAHPYWTATLMKADHTAVATTLAPCQRCACSLWGETMHGPQLMCDQCGATITPPSFTVLGEIDPWS